MIRGISFLTGFFCFAIGAQVPAAQEVPKIEWFFEALSRNEEHAQKALQQIGAHWKNSYTAMVVDLIVLQLHIDQTRNRDSQVILNRLLQFLKDQTQQRIRPNIRDWREWTWSLNYDPHPHFGRFKRRLYGCIDRRMRYFFPPKVPSLIRLDEVEWGGVEVNGIPPLDYPEHTPASEADYLKNSHVVFGLEVHGEARAFPKRILGRHEMARERLGGVELTLVYCTLCGTVIPYQSEVGGKVRKFGTSGFLYRSNKLMFDQESMSLWSTLEGKPVVGSLVGSGLRLRSHPIVTTTWGEWKEKHPDTTVLSLNTGHKLDYSEGAAYRDYFLTDRLMFSVPKEDTRLKNKQEVLVMLLSGKGGKEAEPLPVAISTTLLEEYPVYHTRQAGRNLVVITSPGGANRVYESGDHRFERQQKLFRVEDREGRRWTLSEEALILEGEESTRLPRVSAQRAFWFGWHAQFPDTVLIK